MLDKLKEVAGKLIAVVQGKTTGFFIAFFISGNILQWLHRLDANYTSFMAVLLSAIIGHSVKDDIFNKPDPPPTIPPTGTDEPKG